MHNLTPNSGSSVQASGSLGCTFCHAPHGGGGVAPLWNQTLSTQTYTPYASNTAKNTGKAAVGTPTNLCLSCHDGTVAVGQSFAYGRLPTSGSMQSKDVLKADLNASHPFSLVLPLKDSADLAASLVAAGTTADPTVKLVSGNVECTSCHNPHVQAKDSTAQQFLVRDSSSGQLCLACHDPQRTVTGQVNHLAGWTGSIHQSATNTTTGSVSIGSYGTVAKNACDSCHMPHNASSPVRLLRSANPTVATADPSSQPCLTCHTNPSPVSGVPPNVVPNVAGELAKAYSHPYAATSGINSHDPTEAALLNGNRHSSCVDCHNPHAAQKGASYTTAPLIRSSQNSVQGISATDGITEITPAKNQFENCFRCHGNSTGKTVDTTYLTKYGYMPLRMAGPTDILNVRAQMDQQYSSHPVTHDLLVAATSVPSLRTSGMLNLDGTTTNRLIGSRIFCTDCHNSDDNKEFNASKTGGPSGPHGSANMHILERRYVMAQAPAPGQAMLASTVNQNPDLTTSSGPYAMCAKCHDLSKVMTDTFRHQPHVVTDGVSCSACHTAHGLGGVNANLTGDHLVDFDLNVVGRSSNNKLEFNGNKRNCSLACHGHDHKNSGY
jgi:predicted CXXCH cytochrome family protein